jgi:hypothetical protein
MNPEQTGKVEAKAPHPSDCSAAAGESLRGSICICALYHTSVVEGLHQYYAWDCNNGTPCQMLSPDLYQPPLGCDPTCLAAHCVELDGDAAAPRGDRVTDAGVFMNGLENDGIPSVHNGQVFTNSGLSTLVCSHDYCVAIAGEDLCFRCHWLCVEPADRPPIVFNFGMQIAREIANQPTPAHPGDIEILGKRLFSYKPYGALVAPVLTVRILQ